LSPDVGKRFRQPVQQAVVGYGAAIAVVPIPCRLRATEPDPLVTDLRALRRVAHFESREFDELLHIEPLRQS